MMPKYDAFGTQLEMGRGDTVPGPETFDVIAQVTNLSGPGLALDTEDVTTHDSTGGWEEVVGTVLRTGEMTLEIAYDPTHDSHDKAGTRGLVKKIDAKTLTNFKLTWPDADTTEWAFAAYVTGFEPSAPADGALTASVSLKITGAPTLV
jgi:predicted secreted protein